MGYKLVSCVYLSFILFMGKLTITSYNCRGAMSAAAYLTHFMNNENNDIICVQEHHLYYEHKSFLTTLHAQFTGAVKVCDENNMFSLTRVRKGGLAVLWRKTMDYCVSDMVLPISTDRIMVIRVDIPNDLSVFIVNVYMPTTNVSIAYYRECIADLQIIVDWVSDDGIILMCGDFNGQLGGPSGSRAGSFTNVRGSVLYDFITYNNMFSSITQDSCSGPVNTCWPGDTNNNPSQIDHFIMSYDYSQCIEYSMVHDDHSLNMSDHHPITLVLKCIVKQRRSTPRVRYNWSKCDPLVYTQNLRSALVEAEDLTINCDNDIATYTKRITDIVISTMEASVPQRRFRPHIRPYWDEQLKVLHKEQSMLRHVWINEGRPRGPTYDSFMRYKVAKRRFSKMLHAKQQEFYQKEYEHLEHSTQTNVNNMWKHVKPKYSSSSYSIKHNDMIYSSPDELCKLWEQYYTTLLNEQPSEAAGYDTEHQEFIRREIEHLNSTYNKTDDVTNTLNQDFTVNEVANLCKSLPNNKAAGHDAITYECVKHGGHQLYEALAYLFNHIVQFMHIPASLKHSIIIPLYKGKQKPRTALNSYRGVSLTPTLNKILEKLILQRLKPWLRKQGFPPPLQQAGREGTNCVCLSYAVQEAIQHWTNQRSKVYGCFLDIKSAYDVINWDGLLYKLAKLGISNKLWHFFKIWLSGSTAQIRVQGESSDIFDISRSIKQGGLLSTFFFVVFYHDVHVCVTQGDSHALMLHDEDISSPTMADDTLLLSTTVMGLQTMLNNAHSYGRMWRLEYSPTKTKCITFGESKRSNASNIAVRQWYLGGVPVEEVTTYNYLGIILSADGSSSVRTNTMSRKGYSCFGVLKATGFHSEGLSPITCSTIWQRMLIPSMLYGCEVWGSIAKRELNTLELVQKKVGKYIQGLHRRTHDEIVRGLLGWNTIAGTIDKCKLSFVHKLMSLPPDNVIKRIFLYKLYDILLSPGSANDKSITYDLWSVIRNYDVQSEVMSYMVGRQVISKPLWKQICKSVVYDKEQTCWKEGLIRKGAFRFYHIHDTLKPHLLYSTIKYHMNLRKLLLNVVKLTAFPEQSDECVCTACGLIYTDAVDHYVMKCQGLIHLRSMFWDNVLDSISCEKEAELLRMDENAKLNVLLGQEWTGNRQTQIYHPFMCKVATNIASLMYVL